MSSIDTISNILMAGVPTDNKIAVNETVTDTHKFSQIQIVLDTKPGSIFDYSSEITNFKNNDKNFKELISDSEAYADNIHALFISFCTIYKKPLNEFSSLSNFINISTQMFIVNGSNFNNAYDNFTCYLTVSQSHTKEQVKSVKLDTFLQKKRKMQNRLAGEPSAKMPKQDKFLECERFFNIYKYFNLFGKPEDLYITNYTISNALLGNNESTKGYNLDISALCLFPLAKSVGQYTYYTIPSQYRDILVDIIKPIIPNNIEIKDARVGTLKIQPYIEISSRGCNKKDNVNLAADNTKFTYMTFSKISLFFHPTRNQYELKIYPSNLFILTTDFYETYIKKLKDVEAIDNESDVEEIPETAPIHNE